MTKPTINLTEALQDLESIVENLNTNNLDIEIALKEFKRGVELVEVCRSQLKTAENQFQELKARLEKDTLEQE